MLCRVTILILLEIILQRRNRKDCNWWSIVTILILLEIILQQQICKLLYVYCKRLQSLFYWKSFCNNFWKEHLRSKVKVTILILLEIILQRCKIELFCEDTDVTILILLEIILQRLLIAPKSWIISMNYSYNPYFIGNHSATF